MNTFVAARSHSHGRGFYLIVETGREITPAVKASAENAWCGSPASTRGVLNFDNLGQMEGGWSLGMTSAEVEAMSEAASKDLGRPVKLSV